MKRMSVVVWDYQREKEKEQDNEAEMSRPEMQVLNRQVTKRQRVYFYEKMRRIQRNIEVGDLSMRAAWKVANLNHRSSSPGKEILDVCRRRETRKPRVCVWDHYQFCMNLKNHCCVKNSRVTGMRNGCFIKIGYYQDLIIVKGIFGHLLITVLWDN